MANGIDFGTAVGLIKGLGSPDPAVIESAVNGWLDDHPEATTTVQDGSITKAKLDSNLQGTVDDVADLKSHLNNSLDVSSLGWEIGTMNPGSGAEETSNTRIRSDYVSVTQGTTIKITGNPNCLIVYSFDENKGYLADTTWSSINNSFTVPYGVYYVRILIRVSSSNNTITDADVATQYARCSVALKMPQSVYTLPADVDKLDDKVDVLADLATETVTKISYAELDWTDGGYIDGYGNVQSSSSYAYTDYIPVQGGDVLNGYMRFCTAYNSSKSAMNAYFGNNVSTYTVNSAVAYVRISREKVYKSKALTITREVVMGNSYSKIANVDTVCNGADGIRQTGSLSDSTMSLTAYAPIRNGKEIGFKGDITAFNKLTIGCGTTDVNSERVEIDTTNVVLYAANTAISTTAHGLTFTGYIFVSVDIDGNAKPKITVYTDGGRYQVSIDDAWIGASANIYATADDSTTLTNCLLTFTAAGLKKDIWYCGDSYMAERDGEKIPLQLKYIGVYDHINSVGYSGAGAGDVNPYIQKLFGMGKYPKYLVWALGMNDADSGAVNATWKSVYDQLTALADEKQFELILATIPNTPTVDNKYKNAIVRASGYRYIDFASSVQTEEDASTWKEGMLASDNTHPTAEGSKALASQLCVDFPEIFN